LINQQHAELQSHSAVEHPNTLVNRMAHSIGFYAARTYLGIQNITHMTHEETDQPETKRVEPSTQPSEQESSQAALQTQEEHPSRTSRAEALIDDLTQHLSSFTAMIKYNVQKMTARVREDTEDLWAEAQSIRHHKDQPIMQ
jgi:hypothetical protein